MSADTPIWVPTPEFASSTVMAEYQRWLAEARGLRFADYAALWQWSVSDLAAFWQSIWDFHDLRSATPVRRVLADARMPGARWFEGATLNYAGQVFRHARSGQAAVRHTAEGATIADLSWAELQQQVANLAATLRALGVQPGDRVAGYLPNVPATVVAFLAAASIGAVWSLCSPDMGPVAVLDRFRQITPKVLIATAGYRFGGRAHDRREVLRDLLAGLPGLQAWIWVPDADGTPAPGAQDLPAGLLRRDWADATAGQEALRIEPLPFDHPLWVVYSSGTTGAPKPLVHGHGGIVLEHLLCLGVHGNLRADDVFHWFSSTGWIVWNLQVAGLLIGATIALVDGSPAWPDFGRLWRFVDEAGVTSFGAGSAYFTNCMKAGISPRRIADVSRLRALGATGSPLPPEAYEWVLREVHPQLWMSVISGGTDFAGSFVGGNPMLPVYAGEMQCRNLGARVESFDDQGRPLVDEVGELVCTAPMPSMPLYLWGDTDGRRLKESYFDTYPGIWRHGDWVRITPRGGAIIYGRSDATINRQGVRMGTSELYRVVEERPEVLDSLVVDLEYLGRESWMTLFVVLREGHAPDDTLKSALEQAIRQALSPRHVPNEIVAVAEVPRTLTGKKMEVPVKRLMLGQPLARVANPDAMANPHCLAWYEAFARAHLERHPG